MNEVIIFALVSFAIIRMVGFGISVNYYHETKKVNHLYFIIGWLIWSVAAILPILSGLALDIFFSHFYLLINGILVSTGFLFIASGYFSYFVKIPRNLFYLLTPAFTLIPLLLYFSLSLDIALNFSIITYHSFLIGAYILPLVKWNNFKKIVGKSIKFYFLTLTTLLLYIPISIISLLQGYSYGLYEANDVFLISLNYSFGIGSVVLMIIYFLHLEFTISIRDKDELKDKYSHNLGNILQTVYLSIGLLKEEKDLNSEDRTDLAEVIERKVYQAETLLNEIRNI